MRARLATALFLSCIRRTASAAWARASSSLKFVDDEIFAQAGDFLPPRRRFADCAENLGRTLVGQDGERRRLRLLPSCGLNVLDESGTDGPFDGEAFFNSLMTAGPISRCQAGRGGTRAGRAVGLCVQVAAGRRCGGFPPTFRRVAATIWSRKADMGTLDYTEEGGGLCQKRVSSGFIQGEWSSPHPLSPKARKKVGHPAVLTASLVKRFTDF